MEKQSYSLLKLLRGGASPVISRQIFLLVLMLYESAVLSEVSGTVLVTADNPTSLRGRKENHFQEERTPYLKMTGGEKGDGQSGEGGRAPPFGVDDAAEQAAFLPDPQQDDSPTATSTESNRNDIYVVSLQKADAENRLRNRIRKSNLPHGGKGKQRRVSTMLPVSARHGHEIRRPSSMGVPYRREKTRRGRRGSKIFAAAMVLIYATLLLRLSLQSGVLRQLLEGSEKTRTALLDTEEDDDDAAASRGVFESVMRGEKITSTHLLSFILFLTILAATYNSTVNPPRGWKQ